MSRFVSYINTAVQLIETYKGDKPFAIYQKQFFAANKKYGARDRRQVTALCYNYLRVGFAAPGVAMDEKMLMATFLCETEPSLLLEKLKPEWHEKIVLPIIDKLALLYPLFLPEDIFPFVSELSDGIEPDGFCKSMLVQPDLFIRVRPHTRITVLKKLEKLKVIWQMVGADCVRLSNSADVEAAFLIDKEIVIQDYNSQKVLDYLKEDEFPKHSLSGDPKKDLSVWDCCAASGGKSILANDILNTRVSLTVSDIRASIVLKLHGRFKKAGIKAYKYFIADINSPVFKPGELKFDLIICDAPCSGSGTWSRTPEQLGFFKLPSLKVFSRLQKKIVTSVWPYLESGGWFVYITCSVFKKENEEIAAFIADSFSCALLHQQLLKGYDKKADNMFVAIFKKL